MLAGVALLLAAGIAAAQAPAAPACKGRFFNPITDICWECALPFKLGSNTIVLGNQEDPNAYSGSMFCLCTSPPRLGVVSGFNEPSRYAEASRTAFCLHALGGIDLNPGIDVPVHAQAQKRGGSANQSFYQAHWYTAPLFFWLEVLLDDFCLERGVFDLAYLTEFDPTWGDSEWNFLLNPDVTLFANPLAQAVCSADCIAATWGYSWDSLYWCMGCHGPTFPLTGWVNAHVGGVQASSLIIERLNNKLHREGTMWAASGATGTCAMYPQLVMAKSNYKYQMVYPTPQNKDASGRCCQPYGRSSILWGAGKEVPFVGNDFGYQIFRHRDCCMTYLPSF